MTDAISDRINQYMMDGSDEDLRRLLSIAQLNADSARVALVRGGLDAGARALDCGCGPLGAMAVMADIVGPAGHVIGVDFTAGTVERARAVIKELQLDNVEVVAADIHEIGVEELGGPFDVAYTRCFMVHQHDAVRTLTAIAALLRPGGCLVTQEPQAVPAPRSYPEAAVLARYWQLIVDIILGAGASPTAVDGLPGAARIAGLEVVGTSGVFDVLPADQGFELHAASLLAMRERATAMGVANRDEIDGVVAELRATKGRGYEWVTSPYLFELTAQKPA